MSMSQGLTPALLTLFEGMQTRFCPSGLRCAPGSCSCRLTGRRKTEWLNMCKDGEEQFRMTSEPQVLLGAAKKIERAMLGPSCPAEAKALWRDLSPLTATLIHGVLASCPFPSLCRSLRRARSPRDRAWLPLHQQTCLVSLTLPAAFLSACSSRAFPFIIKACGL